ncbi:cache domain-containing sensor histidine kinase [Paenibacillus aceris]|uniref:Two-component system sensor histidine kinase YesM n=1 Tax=Paenibacillus aceris TaxID=869555 RepID=A0ABS4HXJ5_9BACL|nr:sensor histidine kinase [Paenibacillus aceris]MBP1963389.1 two-component system sensor histidine kinase YesM [Paenibacillus aceris]NHW36104.1 histidine kinase [Paenibacillus aceris]
MKFAYSFRFKLSMLYLITIIVPTIVITIIMPSYYKQIIIRNSMNETNSTVASLKLNIETYLDELEQLTIIPYLNDDIMNALKQKASTNHDGTDLYALLTSNRVLRTTLDNYMRITRNDILGTMIIAKDNKMYMGSKVGTSSDSVDAYPFSSQDWYKKALTGNGKAVFVSSHPQDYLIKPLAENVFSVARMIKDPDTEAQLAFIMADADTNILQKIVTSIHFNVKSSISILDDHNQVLYSTVSLSSKMLDQVASGQMTIKDDNESYIMIQRKLDKANWNIVVLISNAAIQSQFHWVNIIGIVFGLGGLFFTVLVFFSLSRWIIKPFKKMTSLMKVVQRGRFNEQMEIHGKDEIAQLGIALNSMISHLNLLIDSEYRAQLNLRNTELSLRNAEYRSLQAQLQPHFLYNILNGFIGLNRLGQKELLEHSIISLSKMLRYILLNTDQSTIKEEFEFLKSYCNLQKMRFAKKGFEFDIQCEPCLEKMSIPKLLLQPLVENSIIHGMEPINHACLLVVSAKELKGDDKHFVEIMVKDNGLGFEQALTDSRLHIGLNNVKERLRLAFPSSSFFICSEVNVGTQVVIRIPLQEVQG